MDSSTKSNGHIFRIDKFIVPDTAREEFLEQVKKTHKVLRKQNGFVQDNLLELSSGPSEFNFVTIAEWQGQEYIEHAKLAVKFMHKKSSFNPRELFEQLGIKADIGHYQEVN